MSLAHLYNTVMEVFSVADAQTATGGATEEPIAKFTAVPCLLELASGREREILGREAVDFTHWLFCDPIALVEKDFVVINGMTLDVERADDIQDLSHHMENMVRERK